MSCSCGSDCSCGSSCNCGKMYPDLAEQQQQQQGSTTASIVGVAPESKAAQFEMAAGESGAEGCGCGANCKCNPCTC